MRSGCRSRATSIELQRLRFAHRAFLVLVLEGEAEDVPVERLRALKVADDQIDSADLLWPIRHFAPLSQVRLGHFERNPLHSSPVAPHACARCAAVFTLPRADQSEPGS